ncbi:MAG: LptF/LptG family permease [Rhodopirellula sp.]|nr:LptF/LptG family permease [Rhodopirellula sp.]
MTLFDRHLLKRFWHVFAIGFVASYGLYVVFDAFSNADEFQTGDVDETTTVVLTKMVAFYFFQVFPFFDMVGPILTVLSVIGVFALLQRSREIYPILSAGIPSWRLAVPIVVGTLTIELGLIVNQELIIPEIAERLQANRGDDGPAMHNVQPARDYVTNIEISGDQLRIAERKVFNARFLLPVPLQVIEPTTLKANEAIQIPASTNRPAGWLLKEPEPAFEELTLTAEGRRRILKAPSSGDMFVVTDVTVDQLHNRTHSFKFLSTSQLIHRIRNPAYGMVTIRSQAVHLHERLSRPFLILISVLIAIPLTLRRESHSLLLNIAFCTLTLGVLFLLTQVSIHLGRLNVIDIELAAWIPIVVCGTCAAWLSGLVQS